MQGHWSTTFDKLDETGAITESLPIWLTADYSQRQRQFAQLRERSHLLPFTKPGLPAFSKQEDRISVLGLSVSQAAFESNLTWSGQ